MPSKHATGQLATSSNAPRSALCANDVLGRCPRTPLHGQKGVGQRYAATPTSSRRFGASAQHKTISSTLQPFFHGLCPAPSHPSPAARRRGVVKLWKSSGQSVNGRCIAWATLDVVVGNFCATAWQAVDKLWISERRWCRRMPSCSADLRLSRGPPAKIRSPTNEREYAKRENATVGLSRRQRNPTIRALRTRRQAKPRRVVSSAGRAADF